MNSIRNLPVGYFGAVMGIAGLGLSARAAAPLFPGVVRAPAYFTELWVALGALSLAVLLPAYLFKLLRWPHAVREDFVDPLRLGLCGALPVGMSLVAGGVATYQLELGNILWWTSFALLIAYQIWALIRFLSGGIELAQVNAGWLVILVGGIVLPGPGVALGHYEASRFVFAISTVSAAILMPIFLYRAMAAAALPESLRPTWFILLVPPSLIYANGMALYQHAGFFEILYPFALVLAVALFYYGRRVTRWAFGPGWWAFTFPLDALAYAAARYAQDHPAMLWQGIAAAALAAATLSVVILLWQTLRNAASRRA